MSVNDPLAEARQFAETEYSAQEEIIIRKFQRELQEKQAQLAASGNIRSGTMVLETARIRGEEITALLQARLDAVLEGLDLHQVPIDDSIKRRIVDDVMARRETLLQNVVAAYQVNPVTAGLIPVEVFRPELEQRISLSENSVRTQIDRARLMKKPAAGNVNIYHVHGHNPRWITNGSDHSVNVVTTSSEQIFANLRQQLESGVPEGDERKDILHRLAALEKAENLPSFVERYTEFIAAAANHMALVAPFIPALTELLHKALH